MYTTLCILYIRFLKELWIFTDAPSELLADIYTKSLALEAQNSESISRIEDFRPMEACPTSYRHSVGKLRVATRRTGKVPQKHVLCRTAETSRG